MTGELADYCRRVGYGGPLAPDLATLRALCLAHITHIPFENSRIHLGGGFGTSGPDAWDRIVNRGLGGWCYEMNAVFGTVLELLGLPVTRHACGVMRAEGSAAGMGGHLALTTVCEGQRWLVDVGFGSKLAGPLPLQPCRRRDPPVDVGLSQAADGYWRYTEQGPREDPFWFDFRDAPADEAQLDERCAWQATDPASKFVQTLTFQIRLADSHAALRGRNLTITRADTVEKRTIDGREEWIATVRDVFRSPVDAAVLWDRLAQAA